MMAGLPAHKSERARGLCVCTSTVWTLGFSLLSTSKGDAQDAAGGKSAPKGHLWPRAVATWEVLKQRVFTPPIIGCFIGILVGSISPLRALLVPPGTPLPIHRCLQTFSKAYSPAALLVLASSLALPQNTPDSPDVDGGSGAERQPSRQQTMRDLLIVIGIRFLLLPLSFAGLLQVANRMSIITADPLRDFLLTMQATMPSAQNSVLALQVAGEPSRATRMARLLLVIYLAAVLPIAVVLSVSLQHSGLLAVVAP